MDEAGESLRRLGVLGLHTEDLSRALDGTELGSRSLSFISIADETVITAVSA